MKRKTDKRERRKTTKPSQSQPRKNPRDSRFTALFQKAAAGDENSISDLFKEYGFTFGEDEP